MDYCTCRESGVDFNGYCRKCRKKIKFKYEQANSNISKIFNPNNKIKRIEKEISKMIGGM